MTNEKRRLLLERPDLAGPSHDWRCHRKVGLTDIAGCEPGQLELVPNGPGAYTCSLVWPNGYVDVSDGLPFSTMSRDKYRRV